MRVVRRGPNSKLSQLKVWVLDTICGKAGGGGILVNIVPRKFQGQKAKGPQAPRVLALEPPRDNIPQDLPKAFPHITILL